jgi:hypothetical protein
MRAEIKTYRLEVTLPIVYQSRLREVCKMEKTSQRKFIQNLLDETIFFDDSLITRLEEWRKDKRMGWV